MSGRAWAGAGGDSTRARPRDPQSNFLFSVARSSSIDLSHPVLALFSPSFFILDRDRAERNRWWQVCQASPAE